MIALVNSAHSKGLWLKRWWWAKPCWMMTFISHLLADYQFSSDVMQAKESSKNNYMDCCVIEGDNLLSLPCHLIESRDMAWNTKLWWWSHGLMKVWTQSETDLWCWFVCSGSSHSHRLIPLIDDDTGDYGFFPLSLFQLLCTSKWHKNAQTLILWTKWPHLWTSHMQ